MILPHRRRSAELSPGTWFILLIVVLVGIGFYTGYIQSFYAKKEPEKHLAPPGVFYVLKYNSTRTPNGVIGFQPGQQVYLAQINHERQTMTVSDGSTSIEISPSELTNDLDIAAAARQQDAASQARIAAWVDAQRRAYQAYEQRLNVMFAQDVDKYRGEQQKASGVSGASKLQLPAQPSNSGVAPGNPYTYFYQRPVSSLQRIGGGDY